MLFASIFLHFTGSLFILLIVSFAVQTLLSLIRSHLLIFAFISIALRDWPKKTAVWFMSENALSMFYGIMVTFKLFYGVMLHLNL